MLGAVYSPVKFAVALAQTSFHFEQTESVQQMEIRTSELARRGWVALGQTRIIEVRLPNGRRRNCYSRVFNRPALYPAWERVRSKLSPDLLPLAGEIAPREHWVNFYQEEAAFLDSLEGFILHGLVAGEAIVAIVNETHGTALERRFQDQGLDLSAYKMSEQFVLLDAQTTLSSFLRDGQPDPALFEEVIATIISRVRSLHGKARAFGEMVGILWDAGNRAAAISLEELWHAFCQREGLVLYCAYNGCACGNGDRDDLLRVCATHSRVVGPLATERRGMQSRTG